MADPSHPAAALINSSFSTPTLIPSSPQSLKDAPVLLIPPYACTQLQNETDAQAGLLPPPPTSAAMSWGTGKRYLKKLWTLAKWLFWSSYAWINWLAISGSVVYALVLLACMNERKEFRDMYVAALIMPEATFRMGYFGLCVQTPQLEDEWVCSRFRENKPKGLPENVMTKLEQVRMFQRHAILWYFPAVASLMLLLAWITWYFTRDREGCGRKVARGFMVVSCAAGLAACMAPMMVGNTLYFIGPVYGSQAASQFNIPNIVVHWVGFALELLWISLAHWYHSHIGGAGSYTHGTLAEKMGEV